MKAMVLEEFGRPLRLEEVSDPVPSPGEVVVAVSASGVCGTDLKIVSGGIDKVARAGLPRIPGHEVSGTVVSTGEDVDSCWIGTPVVVYFYLYCGECRECLAGWHQLCSRVRGQVGVTVDGGWAQFVRVPVSNIVDVRGIPFVEAAIIADAVATPYHALVTRGGLVAGERCAVIGAGGLGLHGIQIARGIGAAEVVAVDVAEEKLNLARSFGAHSTGLSDFSEWISGGGQSFDIILDTVGTSESLGAASRALAPMGRVVVVGYKEGKPAAVEPARLVRGEISIIGSRASRKQEVAEAVRLVREGIVKPVVGKVYPLESVNEAVASLREGLVSGRAVLAVD